MTLVTRTTLPGMFHRTRERIRESQLALEVEIADLSSRVLEAIYSALKTVFVLGLAAGLVIGGFLVWLTK